ncbi:hypothetical protein D1007_18432 [Hordeum vulgare]|nr:hypothetical protein D1007_18432 [Hordeum vulgare]
MCVEPTSLAVLMGKADKYATADSTMHIKVTASDKVVPAPATPKPAGDNRGGQNNYKRKADQMANNKLVANVEGEAPASQASPPRKRCNQGNPNWLPKQTLEQLLDAPCKIHSGAAPSTHILRQCSIARRLSQGKGMPAPPADSTTQAPPSPPVMLATDPMPAALAAPAPNMALTESMVQAPSAPPTTPASDPNPAPLVHPTPTTAPGTMTTPALPGLKSSQWVDVMEIDEEPAAAIAPEMPSSSGAAEAPNSQDEAVATLVSAPSWA